jgi:hypothetical protein
VQEGIEMNFQPRSPLTPTELARREKVLTAHQAARSEIRLDPDDARQYGERAAGIIRDCKRDVALARPADKLSAFEFAASTLGKAVAERWLPKSIIADRLQEIADAHNLFGKSSDEIQRIIADTVARIDLPPIGLSAKQQKRRLISQRASDLEPEKLVWVWPGRIPQGKLVLLGGPPGLGKSQLTAFMSATVSNGGYWPCGEGSTLPGDVIFMSAEDGVQDTIIPRLMAAGANRERVHIVSAATKPDGTGRKTFSLKTDVDLLEEMAKRIGIVRLIIVDPILIWAGATATETWRLARFWNRLPTWQIDCASLLLRSPISTRGMAVATRAH